MDIDALDGAAGLARVEDGAVDDFFGGPLRVCVWSDVGWVFAPEFKADGNHSICGSLLDGEATGNGACKADVVYLPRADDRLNVGGGAAMEILKDISGKAGRSEDLGYVFNDGRSLRRRLQDHGVASKQCGYEGIDEDQIWVLCWWGASALEGKQELNISTHIPREDDQHHSHGFSSNESLESFLWISCDIL